MNILVFGVLSVLSILTTVDLDLADAEEMERFACGGFHFVRSNNLGGTELGWTSFNVRNFNADESVTVQRLTIRDFFGNVVHDSGPAVGTPLPLNRDFVPPQDVTVVPPGAAYYLSTRDIWGNNPIPEGDQNGFSITGVVEFSTAGKRDLVGINQASVVRRRFIGASGAAMQGEELTRGARFCTPVK